LSDDVGHKSSKEVSVAVLFLSITSVALFSFLAVAVWSSQRSRERESYYANDAAKKIAESQGTSVVSALEFLQEQQRYSMRRRREGHRFGGLITVALGLSVMIFIKAVDRRPEPAYLIGLIPLFIGLSMLTYSYFLAPKEEAFLRRDS
jgi:hypothetical protein